MELGCLFTHIISLLYGEKYTKFLCTESIPPVPAALSELTMKNRNVFVQAGPDPIKPD